MKKAEFFLRLGFTVLALAIFCSTTQAQSGTGLPEKKDVSYTRMATWKEKTITTENQNKSNEQVVAETQQQNKTIDPVKGPVAGNPEIKRVRNCEPKYINKSYSITRANFSKLPKSRQQFVLSNLNKYTIID